MAAGVRVRGSVVVRGFVTAADVATFKADPKVKPAETACDAVFAADDRVGETGNLDV
jgi:hypothetical protein